MIGTRKAMIRILVIATLVGMTCWDTRQTSAVGQESPTDALERGFKSPPDSRLVETGRAVVA
jgi:hypothetical protein